MKKIAIALGLVLGISYSVQANKYKLDESLLTQTIEKSTEVSFSEMYTSDVNTIDLYSNKMASGKEKTRGGYLVRAFFCGGIALHRYYMGTTRGAMWALYFCVPVAGGIASCVDFWGAVFVADFYKKFENNDKWFVWLD